MNDYAKDLRELAVVYADVIEENSHYGNVLHNAADEIDRLQNELDSLQRYIDSFRGI